MGQFLKEQIKVKLSGSTDLTYKVNLYDNPFVKKWLVLFKEILRKKLVLEKNYCFVGFADTNRNLDYLCNQLNQVVYQIDKFNDLGIWQNANLKPYPIRKKFTKDDFMFSDKLTIGKAINGDESLTPGLRLKHDTCNLLHRWFEDLQGQAWNLSKYYYLSDNETKYAIRQLNNLCHEIESWVNAYRKSKIEPEWIRPSQITTFLHAPRIKLEDKDYNYFLENRYDRELGGVYLHWSQVGKTLYEVWRDHDQEVGEGGINHQELFSGEFDIEWGKTITNKQKFKQEEMVQFKKWLKKNNYDWNNPKLALGYIKLGQVDLLNSFGTTDFVEIYNKLSQNLNIKEIEYNGNENLKTEYNYSLSDFDWKQKQITELSKGYESHSLR